MSKKKIILNLDQLVSVDIIDRRDCNKWQYIPFKKSFWGNTNEGFYFHNSGPFTKTQIENGTTVWDFDNMIIDDDNNVYYCPKVVLNFSDGKNRYKLFKTYEEALTFGNECASKITNKLEHEEYITNKLEHSL